MNKQSKDALILKVQIMLKIKLFFRHGSGPNDHYCTEQYQGLTDRVNQRVWFIEMQNYL